MMMSDSLPFTPYDSMEYETVSPQASPPPGFAPRDQVAETQAKDLKKMATAPPLPQQVPIQPKPKLAEEDVDIGPIKEPSQPDISNYKIVYDLVYILVATIIVEFIIIFAVRYCPEIFGQNLNKWYDIFVFNAVLMDIGILIIGFIIARYLYTSYVKEKFVEGKWSPLIFTGCAVGIQIVHDILFYYGVINQLPRGNNSVIDLFKDYSSSGLKIVAGDSVLVIMTSLIAMFLKSQPTHVVASIGTVFAYAVPYILYTKNIYSVK
jgi:hypothetical protein